MPTQAIAPALAGEPADRRTCATRPTSARRKARGHLSATHPLADLVRIRCHTQHPRLPRTTRLGEIGCGACWEYTIRVDERVAVEEDLPPLTGDKAIVDQVAVDRAVKGELVRLTRTEKAAAVRLMAERGETVATTATRLRMNTAEVVKLWPAEAVA